MKPRLTRSPSRDMGAVCYVIHAEADEEEVDSYASDFARAQYGVKVPSLYISFRLKIFRPIFTKPLFVRSKLRLRVIFLPAQCTV